MLVQPQDITVLRDLLQRDCCADIAQRLASSHQWKRRDLIVPSFGTARRLAVLDPDGVAEAAPDLAELYHDVDFQIRIAGAVGTEIVEPIPDSIERYVANRMDGAGDVHGGHFDDHPIAATILLATERSPDRAGWIVENGQRQLIELRPGDCYVLRSSSIWHGVGPVDIGGRVAVTFAFDVRGQSVIVTDSASLIYGKDISAYDAQ